MVNEKSKKSARMEEAHLLRSGEDGDRERLVAEYTEVLLKGALSLGFALDESKDLVQSVWLTFFQVAHRFEGRSKVSTFLFGILHNKAKERRRGEERRRSDREIDEIVDAYFDKSGRWSKPPGDPERFMQAAQTMELIEKCLNGLSITQRMAFCLREIDEHGTSDICKILDVTGTNLGVLLFRAKARLRECIERNAVDE